MHLLEQVAIFLLTAVLIVPIFQRLKLGAVLGYLAAGMIIGPWGLGVIGAVESTLEFSEFGVVLLLFLIGLELEPRRLWTLRNSVFGLGGAQVIATGIVVALLAMAAGFNWQAALIIGLGCAMSSTALVMSFLNERKQLLTRHGRESFAILFFQIVYGQMPEVTSWIINTTGQTGYAGIAANVQIVQYSTDSVYVSCTCIPGYSIGPWTGNPNIPINNTIKYIF